MDTDHPQFEFQDRKIQELFPQFRREHITPPGEALWRGTIQPREGARLYTVSVWYRLSACPRIWVREIILAGTAKRAPHLWGDDSLCLFKPGRGRGEWTWNESESIAHTLLFWTSHWLIYYEIWLDTDKWWGPEALHNK